MRDASARLVDKYDAAKEGAASVFATKTQRTNDYFLTSGAEVLSERPRVKRLNIFYPVTLQTHPDIMTLLCFIPAPRSAISSRPAL
jgi:hypothetical protein